MAKNKKSIRHTKKIDSWELELNLVDLIKKLDELRVEHGDEASLDISAEYYYGNPHVTIELSWHTPETDEEREARENKESALLAKKIEKQLAELERLKKLYPDNRHCGTCEHFKDMWERCATNQKRLGCSISAGKKCDVFQNVHGGTEDLWMERKSND